MKGCFWVLALDLATFLAYLSFLTLSYLADLGWLSLDFLIVLDLECLPEVV